MSKVLYIQASPRIERSYSIATADAFMEAYKEVHPDDDIIKFNIFDKDLPTFDGPALQAKYAILHGLKPSDQELAAWKAVEMIIEEFKAADKYVFAIPMWNFHVPYRLKHYIDILLQPTYTFKVTEEGGYEGLVTGKPVFIAFSRGGQYEAGTPAEAYDFQTKYVMGILGFMGLTDIRSIVIEPTLAGGPDTAKEKRAAAMSEARQMARDF